MQISSVVLRIGAPQHQLSSHRCRRVPDSENYICTRSISNVNTIGRTCL